MLAFWISEYAKVQNLPKTCQHLIGKQLKPQFQNAKGAMKESNKGPKETDRQKEAHRRTNRGEEEEGGEEEEDQEEIEGEEGEEKRAWEIKT